MQRIHKQQESSHGKADAVPTVSSEGMSPWRAATAAGLGTTIEYYDFQLYAVMAVTLSPLFFPEIEPTAALLATLGIFAGAFLVRPLGGIFFGWFGDRFGRTPALLVTIIGIGIASAAIGSLPTYASIGLAAPVLLLLLRLAQGFFAGGEVTGAATYVAESSPPGRRGFFGAFNPAAATLGLAVATAAAGLTASVFGTETLNQWAWRIPFLMSIPLIVLCFWARLRVEDSPKFKEIVSEGKVPKAPFRELLREHRPALFRVISIGFAQNAAGYVCVVYLNIHLTRIDAYDPVWVMWLMSAVTLAAVVLMPLSGAMSDRLGRKSMLAAGFAGYIVLAPVTFFVAGSGNTLLTAVAVSVSILPFIIVQSIAYPLYAEMFPTRVRYSGVSLGFNVATILGGGTAPYVATWLIQATGNPIAPAYYVIGATAIGLIGLAGVRETAHRPLAD